MQRNSPQDIIFIQSRAKTNQDLVDEYANMMREGVQFDATQGIQDTGGQIFVWDGRHRGEAAKLAGVLLLVEIQPGTKQEAEWLALSANQKHGLRRSKADEKWIASLACPMAPEHRYELEQLRYHYNHSLTSLRQYYW